MVVLVQEAIVPHKDPLHEIDPDQGAQYHLGQVERGQRGDQGAHPPWFEAQERRAKDGQPERHAAPTEHQGDLEDEAQWWELVWGNGCYGRLDEEAAQWGQGHEQPEEQAQRRWG
ncbi:hypothetical protein CPB97_009385 [Podila verticillata]|nr:hypothetical protein CPB97_009385 [Podila verticillata]